MHYRIMSGETKMKKLNMFDVRDLTQALSNQVRFEGGLEVTMKDWTISYKNTENNDLDVTLVNPLGKSCTLICESHALFDQVEILINHLNIVSEEAGILA
jgi:hypothetical protein